MSKQLRMGAAVCGVLFAVLFMSKAVWAGDYVFTDCNSQKYVYKNTMLAKAKPDECFRGVGGNNTYPFDCDKAYCDGTPKVNQAYVWGLTKAGEELWFGTAPNVHCMVMGSYLEMTDPVQTDSYVCELAKSKFVPPLPPGLGDWRPADFFVYNCATKKLKKLLVADQKVQTTIGIRAAGNLNGVVLMAGPSMLGGINFFAFNAATKQYLGSTTLPYGNIRKFRVVKNVLYTTAGSRVLRWVGNLSDPLKFIEVGIIDGSGAEIAFHGNRMYIATWPGDEVSESRSMAGVWMGPVMPSGGLTQADAGKWKKIWDVGQYDPDPVTAATYGGGAIESFDGYLYWGTMHVPFLSTATHFKVYGEAKDEMDYITTAFGCHRAISIFRCKNPSAKKPEVEVCYGEYMLPAYDSNNGWRMKWNKVGKPLFGCSGFGNFFNNYTWTMAVYDGKLFVGTMDWSYLAFGDAKTFFGMDVPPFAKQEFGADLWCFESSNTPAVAVSTSGVGNYTNYGIRTMVSDDNLYLGMANPMNLLTDPNDKVPQGGWELKKLYPKLIGKPK